ncbi:MAG: glucose-6-phosphate isomerase [Pseudomonadota bacterium]|nr:glucose-6-phosphate isomerase [Pseudomonadota bacterium]
MEEKVGPCGLAQSSFEVLMATADRFQKDCSNKSWLKFQSIIDQCKDNEDIEQLEGVACEYNEKFDHIIILGTGGSSIGGRTLSALAHDDVLGPVSGSSVRPIVCFLDNLDPDSFERIFKQVELKRTGFIVISKSGGTMETMVQFLYCLDVVRKELGERNYSDHFVSITDPGDRPLRTLCDYHKILVIDHNPNIGGRFSVFSAPGILPALIAGLDGAAIRSGANEVINLYLNGESADENSPSIGAAIAVGLAKFNGVGINVLMPYIDKLEIFGKWYRQLWAESLGKEGQGTTPINALGTVDQHSQLQLYLDGPRDKFFTLICSVMKQRGAIIKNDLFHPQELDYLVGNRIGDVMAAEQKATFETLISKGRPTRVIEIESLDEYTMGSLLMHFVIETVVAGYLMGLDPFDQPAVEEGKNIAKSFLEESQLK